MVFNAGMMTDSRTEKTDVHTAKGARMVVTRYEIPADCNLRIAHISDSHESSPEASICLLRQERPELIVITGDLIERNDDKKRRCAREQWYAERGVEAQQPVATRKLCTAAKQAIPMLVRKICYCGRKEHHEYAYRLLEEAAKIAPVCYSLGNHENYLEPEDYAAISRYGITLLDNSYVQTHGIWVGGLSTLYREAWLEKFRRESGYKILLMHHPEYYDRLHEQLDGIDLILSGHAHGGQWRIAGRGVLAPGQGFFPKYCHGMYDGRLVVSAGMSNTLPVPRFGNPQELVMLQLKKE